MTRLHSRLTPEAMAIMMFGAFGDHAIVRARDAEARAFDRDETDAYWHNVVNALQTLMDDRSTR